MQNFILISSIKPPHHNENKWGENKVLALLIFAPIQYKLLNYGYSLKKGVNVSKMTLRAVGVESSSSWNRNLFCWTVGDLQQVQVQLQPLKSKCLVFYMQVLPLLFQFRNSPKHRSSHRDSRRTTEGRMPVCTSLLFDSRQGCQRSLLLSGRKALVHSSQAYSYTSRHDRPAGACWGQGWATPRHKGTSHRRRHGWGTRAEQADLKCYIGLLDSCNQSSAHQMLLYAK